jgi:hypothetical protein
MSKKEPGALTCISNLVSQISVIVAEMLKETARRRKLADKPPRRYPSWRVGLLRWERQLARADKLLSLSLQLASVAAQRSLWK